LNIVGLYTELQGLLCLVNIDTFHINKIPGINKVRDRLYLLRYQINQFDQMLAVGKIVSHRRNMTFIITFIFILSAVRPIPKK